MKKTKVKCSSVRRTAWQAFPHEAAFRPLDEKRGKGLPRTRIVIESNQELPYEPGKVYSIEVKSSAE